MCVNNTGWAQTWGQNLNLLYVCEAAHSLLKRTEKLEQPKPPSVSALGRLPAWALLHRPTSQLACLHAPLYSHKETLLVKCHMTFFSPHCSYTNISKQTNSIKKAILPKHPSAFYHLFWYLQLHHSFCYVKASQWGKHSSKQEAIILQNIAKQNPSQTLTWQKRALRSSLDPLSKEFYQNCNTWSDTFGREGWG